MRRLEIALLIVALVGVLLAEPAHAVDPPLPDVVQVDGGGGHSCAVDADHKAWCWGKDHAGQVGDGAGTDAWIARQVLNVAGTGPLAAVTQVSAGRSHTCARLANGQARCWGGNLGGQLGDGTFEDRDIPVVVTNAAGNGPLTGVRAIAAGNLHTCAVLSSGQVRCWGSNEAGQLGNGGPGQAPRRRPVVVRSVAGPGPLQGVAQVTTGTHYTCAVLASGQARCWGLNVDGQLADGTRANHRRPVVVRAVSGAGPLTGVRQVEAGDHHACARLASGQARCWGRNNFRQLGVDGGRQVRPVVVALGNGSPLGGVTRIAAGEWFSCASLASGEVRCWGSDGRGQLGNATAGGPGPVAVRSALGEYDPPTPGDLVGITLVSAGGGTACARRNDGRALCWGDNREFQVGNGANPDEVFRPTSVLAPT